MKLKEKIIINPPPYSDNNGNTINPDPIQLQKLELMFTDTPEQKNVSVKIKGIPTPVILYLGKEYDQIGDWTKTQAEKKLLEILGDHPAKYLRSLFPKTMEENPNGPGTVLSKMIKSLGIKMNDNCSCRRHALTMNEKGNDWCESNIDTIVGWLKEEAKRRNLPFIDIVGKVMVNRAIKKSRKLLDNQPVPENDEDLDNL